MLKVCQASLLMHHKQCETNFELIFITFFGMTHISCIFPDDVSRIFPDDVSRIFPDDISRIFPDDISRIFPDDVSRILNLK